MEKHEDVRITKSKRDLCNALTELMLIKPFEKITVGEICERAMINRMTFYKHYNDKYELLNDLLLNIKQSIKSRIGQVNPTATIEESALEFTSVLIEAVVNECLERREFLLAVNNSDLVLTMISTTIEKSVNDILCGFGERFRLKYSHEMLSSAITGAATFLIRHWLYHCPEVSKDYFLNKTKDFFRELFESKILFE